ncbi:MAG: efflux RND transporter periplasmic adaptor subunit [Elusimicrobia bacterium]|nr:efflux RND transporter periplasmic adaptor subunit [Elusimicrobiota bacterium]
MKWKIPFVLAVLGILFGAGMAIYRFRDAAPGSRETSPRYYCPMHPSYTSDKPGDCPICNMRLVPMEEQPSPDEGGAPPGQTASLKNVCVIHKCTMANCLMEMPLKLGEKVSCPICGTHVAQAAEDPETKPLYYRHPMRPEITSPNPKKDEMGMDYVPVYAEAKATGQPPGQASTVITAERRQMIGMKSEEARERDLSTTIRASGRVAYDPDLYNAMSEYREAVRVRDRIKDSPLADVRERAEALVRAGRLRLRQLGLSNEQINAAGETDDLPTNLLIGEPGGTVWVYAQVYEYEIGLLKVGQPVDVRSPAFPDKSFRGRIKAIDPILSAETRSLKVRVEVPNPDGLLKLEMYVNAFIHAHLGRRLAVPESAVFNTGERRVAFVDLGQGRIEPREVKVGKEAEGYVEILSGVKAGERVITSANFLVDSESRLKGSFPKSESRKPAGTPGAAPQEHRH